MTFVNRSVVVSRAVTILRSNETYLCIVRLQKYASKGILRSGLKHSSADSGIYRAVSVPNYRAWCVRV